VLAAIDGNDRTSDVPRGIAHQEGSHIADVDDIDEVMFGRTVGCLLEKLIEPIDVSCHSFIRMAHFAEPLMPQGGCLLAATFYGSERVVEHYNLMGPVKAALESCARYIAAELGPKGIRVHAVSPGAIRTRAASGIDGKPETNGRAVRYAAMQVVLRGESDRFQLVLLRFAQPAGAPLIAEARQAPGRT